MQKNVVGGEGRGVAKEREHGGEEAESLRGAVVTDEGGHKDVVSLFGVEMGTDDGEIGGGYEKTEDGDEVVKTPGGVGAG